MRPTVTPLQVLGMQTVMQSHNLPPSSSSALGAETYPTPALYTMFTPQDIGTVALTPVLGWKQAKTPPIVCPLPGIGSRGEMQQLCRDYFTPQAAIESMGSWHREVKELLTSPLSTCTSARHGPQSGPLINGCLCTEMKNNS